MPLTESQTRYVNFYTDFAFKKLFEQAEIAKYSPQERQEYEESLKNFRDWYSCLVTAERRGHAEGHAEGLAEGLAKGKRKGREQGLKEGRKVGLAEGKKAGLAEGKKAGLAEGKKAGLAEGRRQIAINLIATSMPVSDIAAITGLAQEEILQLKESAGR